MLEHTPSRPRSVQRQDIEPKACQCLMVEPHHDFSGVRQRIVRIAVG